MKMTMEQNPLTGNWLCMIDTMPTQAYYVDNKTDAEKFCKKVNSGIKSGKITEYYLSGNK